MHISSNYIRAQPGPSPSPSPTPSMPTLYISSPNLRRITPFHSTPADSAPSSLLNESELHTQTLYPTQHIHFEQYGADIASNLTYTHIYVKTFIRKIAALVWYFMNHPFPRRPDNKTASSSRRSNRSSSKTRSSNNHPIPTSPQTQSILRSTTASPRRPRSSPLNCTPPLQ